MAIGDVEAAISGGDVEAVRRWIETGGDVVDVRRAGSWRRYSNEPRIRLFLLHALCEAKRAFPPPHPCVGVDFDPPEPLPWGVPPTAAAAARIRAARLSSTPSLATRLYALPAPLVWNVLTFWASARDPDY